MEVGLKALCDIKCDMEKASERFTVNTMIHHVWGLLPSDIHVLYHCHLDLPAVHR